MSITGFKVGHYYRWIGPRDYCEDWVSSMELWKDGNARKCTASDGLRDEFDGIEGCWYYGHCLQHFEEVSSSARELLGSRTTEASFSITMRDYMPIITTKSYTISISPQTLVEKRRATRRRLLGL